jgi:hypothetical protein
VTIVVSEAQDGQYLAEYARRIGYREAARIEHPGWCAGADRRGQGAPGRGRRGLSRRTGRGAPRANSRAACCSPPSEAAPGAAPACRRRPGLAADVVGPVPGAQAVRAGPHRVRNPVRGGAGCEGTAAARIRAEAELSAACTGGANGTTG